MVLSDAEMRRSAVGENWACALGWGVVPSCMLKKILIGVVVLIGVLLVAIVTRPAEYSVERSTTIAAPPTVPFELVNDFHHWERWSPWEKLDPGMDRVHTGSASGEGAKYSWAGNDDVGKGVMTIVSSRPPQAIDIDLEFIEPFASTTKTAFRFVETEGSTTVTWTMSGDNDFVGKAFSLFMDMDAMIGADFEEGLANLKALAESEPTT